MMQTVSEAADVRTAIPVRESAVCSVVRKSDERGSAGAETETLAAP